MYEQGRSVSGLSFADRGAQPLPNIPDPANVYAVQWEGPLRDPDRPSVAVLPFLNMSPDPDQEYFADGMTEEIINALTKLDGTARGGIVIAVERTLGVPVKLSETPGAVDRPAPLIGQHTEEILRELGYGDAEQQELMKKGVVQFGV